MIDTIQQLLVSHGLKKNKLQLRVGVKGRQCYKRSWQMWLNKANIVRWSRITRIKL